MPQKAGDGGSAVQKRRAAPLTDTARDRKNSSTPVASDTTPENLLRCENRPVNRPVNRDTGLEMPCCPVTDLLWV
jgi:hypothetical protein